MELISYCWGGPRGGLGGLVVMKSNHDKVPVSITNVPSNPWRGVSVEYQRKVDHIGYHHDGAGQYHHQANKHLIDQDVGQTQRRVREKLTNSLRLIK